MEGGIVPGAAMNVRTVAYIISTFLVVPGAVCANGALGSFNDVLDTPSHKSRLATKTLFNGVSLAGKRIVCVGQRGHIVYSDDGGTSWNQAEVPVSSDLTAVTFPTSRHGWAVGHDGVILHTVDAGATWNKQFDGRAAARAMAARHATLKNCTGCHDKKETIRTPARESARTLNTPAFGKGPDKPFLDVWFENESNGYAVGAFNMIFRTVNGGKEWEPLYNRTENRKRLHLYAVKAVGNDIFVVGEQGLALKLDKVSGQFRAQKTGYNGTLFGIIGKPGSIIVYGMRGTAFLSRDAGAGWQKVATGTPLGITGSTMAEDGTIVLVNQAGHLLISNNNGESFSLAKTGNPQPASSLVSLGKGTFLIAGLRGMQRQNVTGPVDNGEQHGGR